MDKVDIQRVALFRFARQGYHGTTLRHLAQDLDVTPAAFYYHFKSKDEVLVALIEEIMTSDLDLLRRIRNENTADPLDEMIYACVYGMCHAREEALVVEREAKSLPDEFRKRVRRMVHEYEQHFAECIADEYELTGAELTLATRAVVGLGGSVMQWFREDGPLSAHDVAVAFTSYARGILDRAEQAAAQGKTRRGRRGGKTATRNGSEPVAFEDTMSTIQERVAARRRIVVTS